MIEKQEHHIIFITTGLFTGGAEAMLYKLLSRIDRSKFEISVISLRGPGTFLKPIEQMGISVYCLDWSRYLVNPIKVCQLVMLVNRLEPDLIQTWMYHADFAGIIVKIFNKQHLPLIWNVRKSVDEFKSEKLLTKIIIKACAKLSFIPNQIVYNSKISSIQHSNIGYDSSKINIIPNGFDYSYFKPSIASRLNLRKELKIKPMTPVVGLIGRWHPQKDHLGFLKAAIQVSKWDNKVIFILTGKNIDIYNNKLMHCIKRLKMNEKVILLGERKDIMNINNALDVAVSSSSHGEGFSNVVGEAMSCGVPCVVTDVGDSAWIVGNAGKVVPPSDPEALANGIIELLKLSSAKRKTLGLKARRRVKSHFSLDNIVRKYEELYNKILTSTNPDRR